MKKLLFHLLTKAFQYCNLLSVRLYAFLLLVAVILGTGYAPLGTLRLQNAHAASTSGVRITVDKDTVQMEWSLNNTDAAHTPMENMPGLTLMHIVHAQLPGYVVMLRLTDQLARSVGPTIEHVVHTAWLGAMPSSAAVPSLYTDAGEQLAPLATTPPPNAQSFPDTPIVVLREGYLRGERIAVVALSPLFEHEGQVHIATEIQATIPHAELLTDETIPAYVTTTTPFLSNGPAPTNPLAKSPSFKVHVAEAGMQRITGTLLAEAGIALHSLDPASISLWHNGIAVSLDVWGTDDGIFDTEDELRFYAPPFHDRWNTTDVYWMSIADTPGQRMPTRQAVQQNTSRHDAPATTAWQQGVWHTNSLYDSKQPGPDGDHWFATKLSNNSAQGEPTWRVSLPATMPIATGTAIITITGSAYTDNTHQLDVQMGVVTDTATWDSDRNWEHTFTLETTGETAIDITVASTQQDTLAIDSITWELPVHLEAQKNRKETFFSIKPNEATTYEVAHVPTGSLLYDITNPIAPQRVIATASNENTVLFEHTASTQHTYTLANTAAMHTPQVRKHTPVDMTEPLNADALYIAPSDFHATLTPLVQHRQTQGYAVAVVDVQALYDNWSYGLVSPEAIRSFLRYAATTWNPTPLAVTLVGDGTYDPHNYMQFDNPTIIPPYMAMVDLWLGETACETCYVQLDSEDPLDDVLPDLSIGRLPVKNTAELAGVVAKIVAYETAQDNEAWRSRAVFIADNYHLSPDETDGAGNFPALAEASVALQPANMQIERVYYEPFASAGAGAERTWFESDAMQAHRKTLDVLSAGAGLVTFVGHGFYWQWGDTDSTDSSAYLLGLYDVDRLTNSMQLPIVLTMACLTSAFQHPSHSGTSINERFMLHPDGGAVAVWGATGMGLAAWHDRLQEGFYGALWNEAGNMHVLGTLTLAGYSNLFQHNALAHHEIGTFALFGDPLTPARIFEAFSQNGTDNRNIPDLVIPEERVGESPEYAFGIDEDEAAVPNHIYLPVVLSHKSLF